MLITHHPKTGWMIAQCCLLLIEHEASSRLTVHDQGVVSCHKTHHSSPDSAGLLNYSRELGCVCNQMTFRIQMMQRHRPAASPCLEFRFVLHCHYMAQGFTIWTDELLRPMVITSKCKQTAQLQLCFLTSTSTLWR
jgi:hypothetical protein